MREKRVFKMIKNAYARYDRFMEKQGFGVVLAVCVLIILSSALYTFHFRNLWNQKTVIHQEEAAVADALTDQTLEQAREFVSSQGAASFPAATQAPFVFAQPVEGFLDRDFSMMEPQLFTAANYYRLHPGIDLQVAYGTAVKSCADGRVLRVWQDNELGLCIRIRHSYGYEAVYAGLSDASYVKQGDPVRSGQTIGHAGNGVMAENDQQPHLHLEVWLNETAVDPVGLFLGIMQ